tara:strand:+ start:4575 stop:5174 length:600 start_codon:yes stop_codon:yes gene_type:complete
MNTDDIILDREEHKRERKFNAIKLPVGLNQSMIPKYVVYYRECYNQKKKMYREFFKIEKHPKIPTNKLYVSSKSNKINILEKLNQIKKILEKIENEQNEDKDDEDKEDKHDKEDKDEEEDKNEEEKNDEDKDEQKEDKILLPKYINIRKHEKDANKYYIIYDRKYAEIRNCLKALCSTDIPFQTNLKLFLEKVNSKFTL